MRRPLFILCAVGLAVVLLAWGITEIWPVGFRMPSPWGELAFWSGAGGFVITRFDGPTYWEFPWLYAVPASGLALALVWCRRRER